MFGSGVEYENILALIEVARRQDLPWDYFLSFKKRSNGQLDGLGK